MDISVDPAVRSSRQAHGIETAGTRSRTNCQKRSGRVGAHPMNDRTSLQIIPVQPGEADWCIDIAEQLMEHFFEAPKMRERKIAEVNAKLTGAGKPPIKR